MTDDIRRRLRNKLRRAVEDKVLYMVDELEIEDFLSEADIESAIGDALTSKLESEVNDILEEVVDEVIDDLI